MTSATTALLQPQRGAKETYSAYKDRRAMAHNYVDSMSAGELVWNPQMQGTYKNDDRQRLGKAGVKQFKRARHLAREKKMQVH